MPKLLIMLFCLLLTACGFHLRGLIHFPPHFKEVYLVPQQTSPAFVKRLQSQLEAYHVTPLPEPTHARYLIVLEKDTLQQTLLNVSASTAPRQYQLLYHLQFYVTTAKGLVLLPPQLISVQRQVTINNNRILGSNFEMHTIEDEMRTEAATQLLSRLSLITQP